MQESKSPITVRHKIFTYTTNLKWIGDRSAALQSEGKPDIRVASPPEFKGEKGVWTPEDLFVAAVEICLLTTFSALMQKKSLAFKSYTSTAEGTLEFKDGKFQFTKITVKPHIIIDDRDVLKQMELTLLEAHQSCLIANSILAEVKIDPTIRVLN